MCKPYVRSLLFTYLLFNPSYYARDLIFISKSQANANDEGLYVQWFQGIHHTIHIQLNRALTARDIRNIYQERYEGEPLVKVVGESPQVKNIAGTHGKFNARP